MVDINAAHSVTKSLEPCFIWIRHITWHIIDNKPDYKMKQPLKFEMVYRKIFWSRINPNFKNAFNIQPIHRNDITDLFHNFQEEYGNVQNNNYLQFKTLNGFEGGICLDKCLFFFTIKSWTELNCLCVFLINEIHIFC